MKLIINYSIDDKGKPMNEAASGNQQSGGQTSGGAVRKVALVGNPNVGKSVLFNALTGAYVTVSNYPGTSVEVSRGSATIDGIQCEIIDTPGMYAILPITEEERVAREILLNESPDLIIHVLDARNLERMLSMTLQLVEAGLPVLLVVNIMDEAERMGIGIDIPLLQEKLGIPVIGAATAKKRGSRRSGVRSSAMKASVMRFSAIPAGWRGTSTKLLQACQVTTVSLARRWHCSSFSAMTRWRSW